jgi:hypothetical protein
MRRYQIYLIILLLLAIAALLSFQYLFSIYEVDIRVTPPELYADNKSECIIEAVPLNSFGMKVPFRNSSAGIEIREGTDLVEIIEINEQKGFIRIRAGHKPGTVVIFIKPEKSLLPSPVEIRINPNIT